MNITPWMMYWLTRLDEICCVCLITAICSGIVALLALMNACGFPDHDLGWYPEKSVFFYRMGVVFSVAMIVGVLTPSTKEMAAILIIPKIVNNDKVAQLPSKIVDLATDWLDALKPKK